MGISENECTGGESMQFATLTVISRSNQHLSPKSRTASIESPSTRDAVTSTMPNLRLRMTEPFSTGTPPRILEFRQRAPGDVLVV